MQVISILDSRYPSRLRQLADPPGLLFCQGEVSLLATLAEQRFVVGIVGTRRATDYGLRVAAKLAGEITSHAGIVVSGLALGIDGAAHKGAIEAVRAVNSLDRGRYVGESSSGVAVLGGGLNRLYPQRHRRLAEAMIEAGGVIVSEYHPDASPLQVSFLERNRIVAGLSDVVLVVEAPRRSGALATASMALEAGRDVMAIPGPIDSVVSEGTNDLIKRGAAVVTGISDIIEQNSVTMVRARQLSRQDTAPGLTSNANPDSILAIISHAGAADFELLVQHTGRAPECIRSSLAQLELQGKVFVHPGGLYSLREFVDTL